MTAKSPQRPASSALLEPAHATGGPAGGPASDPVGDPASDPASRTATAAGPPRTSPQPEIEPEPSGTSERILVGLFVAVPRRARRHTARLGLGPWLA